MLCLFDSQLKQQYTVNNITMASDSNSDSQQKAYISLILSLNNKNW